MVPPPGLEPGSQEPVDIAKLLALGLNRIPTTKQEVVFLFGILYKKSDISYTTKVQELEPGPRLESYSFTFDD